MAYSDPSKHDAHPKVRAGALFVAAAVTLSPRCGWVVWSSSPLAKSIRSYLGIIHRLGLLAKSSLASKLASGFRVFIRIFNDS
jgi:hypothetical protein